MAEHDHLPLTRVQRPPSPRRKPRSGYRPSRSYGDFGGHSSELDDAAERSVQEFQQRQEEITDFDPKLILRFDLNRRVDDAEWQRSGLTVLDSGDQHAVIVFADDENLDLFRKRLAKYAKGPGEPQPRADGEGETEPTAPHEGFFDAIDSFRFPERGLRGARGAHRPSLRRRLWTDRRANRAGRAVGGATRQRLLGSLSFHNTAGLGHGRAHGRAPGEVEAGVGEGALLLRR